MVEWNSLSENTIQQGSVEGLDLPSAKPQWREARLVGARIGLKRRHQIQNSTIHTEPSSYVQQFCRCGRDGSQAMPLLLYNSASAKYLITK